MEALWKCIETDATIGMTTPKILLYDRKDTIDAAGLTIYPDGLSIGRGHLEPQAKYNQRRGGFLRQRLCFSLTEERCSMRSVYWIGDFFAYAEDTDLGWRARLAGWKAYYVPEAIVYHHHSKQFGTYSSRKAFLVERNRIWVALKNFPLSILALIAVLHRFEIFLPGDRRSSPEEGPPEGLERNLPPFF